MDPTDCFYGGRADTFALQINIDKINESFNDIDKEEIKYLKSLLINLYTVFFKCCGIFCKAFKK